MLKLVLDASTMILLAKLDLLDRLSKEMAIEIPKVVAEEATCREELLDAKQIRRLMEEGNIHVEREREIPWVRALERDFRLGEGEAQAIFLAKKKGALLGVDDGLAMKACKVLGIPFVTTLAFVARFYEKGLLNRKQAIEKLENLKRFGWYRGELLEKVIRDIKRSETA